MHTVLINASKNHISEQMDALWMEREYQQIITMNCPLDAAGGWKKGFASCALKIGEQIDISKDINNDFNLVVYMDYLEMEKHFRELFPDLDSETWVENGVYETVRDALAHLFATALYQELDDKNRLPREKILLLLEQKPRRAPESDYVENQELLRTKRNSVRIDVLCKLLGLPSEQAMCDLADEAADGAVLADQLRRLAQENRVETNGVVWQEIYHEQLEIFFEEISENKAHVRSACEGLCRLIDQAVQNDRSHTVLVSPFITDRRGLSVNKALDAKRSLLLQMFLWECIHSNSIYANGGDDSQPKIAPHLVEEDWQKLAEIFRNKQKGMKTLLSATKVMGDRYLELGLVPPLFKLPHEKFGLDKSGNPQNKQKITIKPADESKKKKENKAGETAEQDENKPQRLVENDRVSLEGVSQRKTNWFEGQYTGMDVEGKTLDDRASTSNTAAEFVALAEDLVNQHEEFMTDLHERVVGVMSNYAGRSWTNAPALLRKRMVSTEDAAQDAGVNDYKYTDGNKQPETDVKDNVVERAKQSYLTLLLEYLKFNAGRGVAMTSIKEQCKHFVNRVLAIEESLKVLHIMFLVVGALLVLLYVPFPLIQWELITRNATTVALSLLNFAVPAVLLVVGYLLAVAWQKRKMKKAWDELMNKSRAIIEDNKRAVREYEALLTMHIPSLRWIYEYVLDVEFFRECNRIATAKLAHHKEKLAYADEMLGNIVEDLEYDNQTYHIVAPSLQLDYTQAFCEGSNRQVYAVIDDDVKALIEKRRSA